MYTSWVCFVWQAGTKLLIFLQCQSMGVYGFPLWKLRINTNLKINPKLIPYNVIVLWFLCPLFWSNVKTFTFEGVWCYCKLRQKLLPVNCFNIHHDRAMCVAMATKRHIFYLVYFRKMMYNINGRYGINFIIIVRNEMSRE